jgi:hypothetical protein
MKLTGTFLGLPYDFRWPTLARFRKRFWNPRDRRLFTPKAFGWGLDLNLHELLCRLGLKRRPTTRSLFHRGWWSHD